MANLHPSSYAPAGTVKSKKNRKKFKKFQFFLRETLTKVLSAYKNSSWNHIPRRRGKKTKTVLWKSYFQTHFEALNLFFCHALQECDFMMNFCRHLELLSMFLSKKFGNFWFFSILLFMREHMSSGAEWTFRECYPIYMSRECQALASLALNPRMFPMWVCAVIAWITQISLLRNPVLSGHNLCFDGMCQWGMALKHGTRGKKTVQNVEGSTLTLRQKSCQ